MSLTIKNTIRVIRQAEIPDKLDLDKLRLSPHTLPYIFNKDWTISENYFPKLYEKLILGKKETLNTEAVKHGIEKEQESIDLVNSKLGTDYVKNEIQFDNGTFKGTPDIIFIDDTKETRVIDIKTVYPNMEKYSKGKSPVEVFDKINQTTAETKHLAQLMGYYVLLKSQWSISTMSRKVSVIYTDLLYKRIKVFDYHITPASEELFLSRVKRLYQLLVNKYNYDNNRRIH